MDNLNAENKDLFIKLTAEDGTHSIYTALTTFAVDGQDCIALLRHDIDTEGNLMICRYELSADGSGINLFAMDDKAFEKAVAIFETLVDSG